LECPPFCSFCYQREHIFVDPTSEEEDVVSSSVTIVFNDKGNMVSFLKYGGTKVAEEHLQPLFELAKQKTKELCKLL
jgi:exosome complex component RRP45